MSSKSPVRACEDVDETALSYAEIKALCAGNPLIAEKMNLDVDVAKLRMLKSEHQSQHYRLEDDLLKRYPEQITAVQERIAGIEKDIGIYTAEKEKTVDLQPSLTGDAVSASTKFPGMTINGVEYTEKEPAAKALLDACKGVTDKNDVVIGSYMGFNLALQFDSFNKAFKSLLRGSMTYQVELGTDTFGNITRINNALSELPKRLEGAQSQLQNLTSQQEAARLELEKPFALEDELIEKETRLALLNVELNIDGSGNSDIGDGESREEPEPMTEAEYQSEYEQPASAKSARPPLLDESLNAFGTGSRQAAPGKRTGFEI